MLAPTPIDENFTPYTKRPVLRRNASLFIDSSAGRAHGSSRVIPQSASCQGKKRCDPCFTAPDGSQLFCINGECVGTRSDCP